MRAFSFFARVSLALAILSLQAGNARTGDPVITRGQIEADWLRQDEVWGRRDEVREKPKQSRQDVTPALDAAGAVDWWSRGGGGVYILSGFKSDKPTLRCLTIDWHEGNFLRPDLSHDGKRVLVAYARFYPDVADVENKTCKEDLPEDAFYHIFEMNMDGSGVRQLTHGRYDDFDARYLPDGDVVFLSTRKGTAIQMGKSVTAATCSMTQPDSYVRCGGGQRRPVSVFTLHRMGADGGNLRPISAFENFEWTPSVAGDGRIVYARWDYIDRFNGPFISLWSTLPDGRGARLVYGHYTLKPQCVFEARPVPQFAQARFYRRRPSLDRGRFIGVVGSHPRHGIRSADRASDA